LLLIPLNAIFYKKIKVPAAIQNLKDLLVFSEE